MGGLEVTVSNRKTLILHYNICMCVCGIEGGEMGKERGRRRTERETSLF